MIEQRSRNKRKLNTASSQEIKSGSCSDILLKKGFFELATFLGRMVSIINLIDFGHFQL